MRQVLSFCLFLVSAIGNTEFDDAEAMLQTKLESQSQVETQQTTMSFMTNLLGLVNSRWPNKPHLHKKKMDQEEGDSTSSSNSVEKSASCTEDDARGMFYHFQGLFEHYAPKFEKAMKENNSEVLAAFTEDLLPESCDPDTIGVPPSVKWDKLEACLVDAGNVSATCAGCPVKFMQKAIGQNLLELPFSCATSCGQVATMSLSCTEASAACNADMYTSMVPCLECMNPKFAELGKCTGLPYAKKITPRLNKVVEAIRGGEGSTNKLLHGLIDGGREELAVVVNSTALNRMAGLVSAAVSD